MSDRTAEPSKPNSVESSARGGRRALLEKHRWLVFVLPFAVYMVGAQMEPHRPIPKAKPPAERLAEAREFNPMQPDGPPAGESGLKTPGVSGMAGKEHAAPVDASVAETAEPKPEATEEEPGDAKPQVTKSDEEVDLAKDAEPVRSGWLGLEPRHYPLVYTIKIVLTLLAIVFVLPGYREFPPRISPLAVLVGAAGIIVWIGLCQVQLGFQERLIASSAPDWLKTGWQSFTGAGARVGFDPFREFAGKASWQLWGFVAVRMFGLVAVVALIEEFFLRGFVMRYVMCMDWWKVPVGQLSVAAVVACVVYAVLSHPAELFAAPVWFLLVTLLAWKTKNLWDCVVAHATTNLLLGIYVLVLHAWQLW